MPKSLKVLVKCVQLEYRNQSPFRPTQVVHIKDDDGYRRESFISTRIDFVIKGDFDVLFSHRAGNMCYARSEFRFWSENGKLFTNDWNKEPHKEFPGSYKFLGELKILNDQHVYIAPKGEDYRNSEDIWGGPQALTQ